MSPSAFAIAWSGRRPDSSVPRYAWDNDPGSQDVARLVLDPEVLPDQLALQALTFQQAMNAEIEGSESNSCDAAVPADFPAIASVHAVLRTVDGYFICSLRRPQARYQASRWSVSFEEQVQGGHGFDTSPADTAMRGLAEEFSPALPDMVRSVTLTAIGREMYSEQDGARQVRSTFMAVDVVLTATLGELDDLLSTAPPGIDLDESTTWLALRPRLAADWLVSKSPHDVIELGGESTFLRGVGDGVSLPWHATSLVRLELSGYCV